MKKKQKTKEQKTIDPEELKNMLRESFTKSQTPMIKEDYIEEITNEIRGYFMRKLNTTVVDCDYELDIRPHTEEEMRLTHTRARTKVYIARELAQDKTKCFSLIFKYGYEAIVSLSIERDRIIIEYDHIKEGKKETKKIEELKVIDIKDVKIEEKW